MAPEHDEIAIVDDGLHRSADGARHEHLLVELAEAVRLDPRLGLDSVAVAEVAGRSLEGVEREERLERLLLDPVILERDESKLRLGGPHGERFDELGEALDSRPEGPLEMRERGKRQAPTVEALDKELRQLRSEQRNVSKAIALASGELPDLVEQMRQRDARITEVQKELNRARRSPNVLADLLARGEAMMHDRAAALRATLAKDPAGARQLYADIFPYGLEFEETEHEGYKVFLIRCRSRVSTSRLVGIPSPSPDSDGESRLGSDPSGIRTRVAGVKDRCPGPD